jgi:hypothetical protein
MILLPPEIDLALRANDRLHRAACRDHMREPDLIGPHRVVRLDC